MEDTMLDLLNICRQKEVYSIHNNVEDLIESALNSKLLLINLNSQRLNKEEQQVKNIAEPAAKRQTRITSCLQNFKVISKESNIPLNKTPQISLVNAIIHDLPIEEPEDSLIMGNEELSTIPKKESDKFIKSSIEALKLTPSIPFVLEYPSSSPIPVVDSDFLIEEVDTFLVPEDLIPPGIESDLGSEGGIIFSNDLLNDDHILEYERFTFDIEPDVPVINNFDEINEDECFDLGGGEIDVSQNIEDDDSFAFFIQTFLPYLTYPVDSPLLLSTGSEEPFLTLASSLRADGISSGWNFHVL
ncbi:hypothetical protein Tco_0163354 [Tanacetum coccineum]